MLNEFWNHWVFLSGSWLESLSPWMEVVHARKFLVAVLDSPECLGGASVMGWAMHNLFLWTMFHCFCCHSWVFLLGDSDLFSQKQFTQVRVTTVVYSLLLLAQILISPPRLRNFNLRWMQSDVSIKLVWWIILSYYYFPYRLDGLGFDSQQGTEIFLFSKMSRPVRKPFQPPLQWILRVLSLRVRMSGAIPLLPLQAFTDKNYLYFTINIIILFCTELRSSFPYCNTFLNVFHVFHVHGFKAVGICNIFSEGFSDYYEMERPVCCHTLIWKTIMRYY